MPLLKVKKVVAVCFLEAAKTTLEHLGAYRLEQSQQKGPSAQDLPRIYGDVRRLRDYLQRCASAYHDHVELDLGEGDLAMLVACCRRSIEVIDQRLGTEQTAPTDERQWLQKKRQLIADWAVELAAKPLLELPLKRLVGSQTEAARTFLTRLQHKAYGDVNERKKILPPSSGQNSLMTGVASFDSAFHEAMPSEEGDSESLPQVPPFQSQPELVPEVPAVPVLIDSQKLRDPRLRSLVAMDLRSYERCVAAGDYRLAAVLLASLLESALLDHVMPRRSELGLTGAPDTWNPQGLLLRVMGESGTPKDRALAYHLFGTRNLLLPALQMVTPGVVTVTSFERLREVVQRALHSMGFKAAAPGPDASAIFNATSLPTVG